MILPLLAGMALAVQSASLTLTGQAPIQEHAAPVFVHVELPNVVSVVEAAAPAPEPKEVELLKKHFGDHWHVMYEISDCESGTRGVVGSGRQFDNAGNVITSPTGDFGFLQINEYYHDATAKRLGLDYKGSLEDNIKMGRHVFDLQGYTAWYCYVPK